MPDSSPILRTFSPFQLMAFSLLLSVGSVRAVDRVTYDDQLTPFLRNHCLNCHNSDKKKADLDLSNYNGIRAGGGTGPAVAAGDASGSLMWKLINHQQEPHMPPKGPKLPDAELAVVRQWIEGGLLENSGSKAVQSRKPRLELSSGGIAAGRPVGPPPMPNGHLLLEPVLQAPRAGAITALAASPWAPVVAVAGQRQVLLHHLDTLDILGILPFPEGFPYVVKFSQNGRLLMVGGGVGAKLGKVALYDVTTGKRLTEVGDELDSVLAADVSADQTLIALGGSSKAVRIYSTSTGELLHTLKKHTDWVTAMAFSPDGVLLVTGDRNGGVHVWESATAQPYSELRAHQQAVTDIAWRDDSNLIATSSEDGQIMLWEPENSSRVRNWAAHPGGVQSVRFGHDGRLVSAGRDRLVKLWDANGGQQKAFEALADLAMTAVISDGMTRVVAGDFSGEVRVWNVADGKTVGLLSANPPRLTTRLEGEAHAVKEARELKVRSEAQLTRAREQVNQSSVRLAVTRTNAAQTSTAWKTADQVEAAARKVLAEANARRENGQKDLAAREAERGAKVVALAAGRQARDEIQKSVRSTQSALAAAEAVQKAALEAGEKAKGVTNVVPAIPELSAAISQSTAAATQALASVTGLRKALTQLGERGTAADASVVAAELAESQALAEVAASQKLLADLGVKAADAASAVTDRSEQHKKAQTAAASAAKEATVAEAEATSASEAYAKAQAELAGVGLRVSEIERRILRWKAAEVNVGVLEVEAERDKKVALAQAAQAQADQRKLEADRVIAELAALRQAIEASPTHVSNQVGAVTRAAALLDSARGAVPQLASNLTFRLSELSARSNQWSMAAAALSDGQGRLKAIEEGRVALEATRQSATGAVVRARVALDANKGITALTNALVQAEQGARELGGSVEALRTAQVGVAEQVQTLVQTHVSAQAALTHAVAQLTLARQAVESQPTAIQAAEKGLAAATEALGKARAARVDLPKAVPSLESKVALALKAAETARDAALKATGEMEAVRQRHEQRVAEYRKILPQG